MKKYIVTIEETVSEDFSVTAENKDEAIKIAIAKYNNEDFVLNNGEVQLKRVSVISPAEDDTKWVEF